VQAHSAIRGITKMIDVTARDVAEWSNMANLNKDGLRWETP
jgi:2-keto-4-pentenoate hydratase/2-oxohepta-3-ene-1,7-dioic acid hydratase in catechol pathway